MVKEDDAHVSEWEDGLPTDEELTPLSHSLISPALASAFSIEHEPAKTAMDVQRGSRDTLHNLRNNKAPITSFDSFPCFKGHENRGGSSYERRPENSYGAIGDDSNKGGGTSKNVHKRGDSESEDDDSAGGPENSGEEPNARTLKRPRLVWTPQLHKRFVDAVGHLGIKNAVPKTIMQLMNVEGLTRENVASHLQKYRLYLKRMQGLSSEGPSASDHLFASTPIPPNLGGPHYMPNHRDDVGPLPFASPNVPIPYTAIAPYPIGPGHYGRYEQYPYSAVGRGLPQQSPRGDHREAMMDNRNHQNHSHNYNHNHNQPSSPPQRILTLFPTSSH
ncbi:unnamed protein product [Sphagnum jensenii]|uniref:HTH myb-type domain-containing protein n=1 Tax=Sphagnum jensenii TaxID=128206 RepID=A0ABP1ALG2_9BRYO